MAVLHIIPHLSQFYGCCKDSHQQLAHQWNNCRSSKNLTVPWTGLNAHNTSLLLMFEHHTYSHLCGYSVEQTRLDNVVLWSYVLESLVFG